MIEALALAALVAAATPVERRYGLPGGLLVAVVLVESGGRNIISQRRRCGGRDDGYGQIHAHKPSKRRLGVLLALSTNLDRAGYLLAKSRDRCARARKACRCLEAHYNWNSRTWCGRVYERWARLRGGEV